MFKLRYAEVMVSDLCNLSCEGCLNYSNYNYSGFLTWEQGCAELKPWADVLELKILALTGGEPLLHPHVEEWLYGLRRLWPNTTLVLPTNGTALRNHQGIVDTMVKCAPSLLRVHTHVNYNEIKAELRQIVDESPHNFVPRRFLGDKREWTKVAQDGVGLSYYLPDTPTMIQLVVPPSRYLRFFRGFGADMLPWNSGDPQGAIDICVNKYCTFFYEGKLYKCSNIALLKRHLTLLGIQDKPEWQPYLSYEGISPSETAKISAFIDGYGKPEAICDMCPGVLSEETTVEHEVLTKAEWLRRHGTEWPPRP